jgi:hypothetical protein
MAISDEAFELFLRSDAPKLVLVELDFAYESGGAKAQGTVYLSTGEYFTRAYESPANISYRAVVRRVPVVAISMPESPVEAQTRVSGGDLELDNEDGTLDFMARLILDGYDARYFVGHPSWPRADFRPLYNLVTEGRVQCRLTSLVLAQRDARLLLDKRMGGARVSERESLWPIALADAYNVRPVLLDKLTLKYGVLENFANASSFSAIVEVRDAGVSLDSGVLWSDTNATFTAAAPSTLTRAAHGLSLNDVVIFTGDIFPGVTLGQQYWVTSTGLTANDFQLSLTKGGAAIVLGGTSFAGTASIARRRYFDNTATDGTLTLSSTPSSLTVDIRGAWDVDGTELLTHVLEAYGGLAASQFDAASLTGTVARLAGRAVVVLENVMDVLDDIARAYLIFYGPDHLGVIRGAQLALSSLPGETAAYSIAAGDVQDLSMTVEAPDVAAVTVLTVRNASTQNDSEFVGVVDQDDRRKWSSMFQETGESATPAGTTYSSNFPLYHRVGARIEHASASVTAGAPAVALAADVLSDARPPRTRASVTVGLEAFDWELGSCVSLAYPRYDLDEGVNFRLVGKQVDPLAPGGGCVHLTLLARRDPDYLTGSYA